MQNRLFSLEYLDGTEELELFSRLFSKLGSGEAASLAYAYYNNYFLLSDENNRDFMREVRGTITEGKLKRLPEVLFELIRLGISSLSEMKDRIKDLENRASTPRDFNDIEHLKRVLKKVEKMN